MVKSSSKRVIIFLIEEKKEEKTDELTDKRTDGRAKNVMRPIRRSHDTVVKDVCTYML